MKKEVEKAKMLKTVSVGVLFASWPVSHQTQPKRSNNDRSW